MNRIRNKGDRPGKINEERFDCNKKEVNRNGISTYFSLCLISYSRLSINQDGDSSIVLFVKIFTKVLNSNIYDFKYFILIEIFLYFFPCDNQKPTAQPKNVGGLSEDSKGFLNILEHLIIIQGIHVLL